MFGPLSAAERFIGDRPALPVPSQASSEERMVTHTFEGWVRSSYCEAGACLEVTAINDDVVIRNSTDASGPRLTVSSQRWSAFLADLKSRPSGLDSRR